AMDRWWGAHFDALDSRAVQEDIEFTCIFGGAGRMSRAEIVLHLVNHTSYHRGFVDDMLGRIPASSPACDFPVSLQEMQRDAASV
ncbi:MAG: DinB family protein, partial [Albidovulum sp.]|uniref:DinB family protein n=1 Tax=Albidovulum sp. TaxID=1872424 RepID=UPI003CB37CE6